MKVKYYRASHWGNRPGSGWDYEVLEVDELTGALRIIDESREPCGYLYSPTKPQALCGKYQGGRFEIIEDDENRSLYKAIYG